MCFIKIINGFLSILESLKTWIIFIYLSEYNINKVFWFNLSSFSSIENYIEFDEAYHKFVDRD